MNGIRVILYDNKYVKFPHSYSRVVNVSLSSGGEGDFMLANTELRLAEVGVYK